VREQDGQGSSGARTERAGDRGDRPGFKNVSSYDSADARVPSIPGKPLTARADYCTAACGHRVRGEPYMLGIGPLPLPDSVAHVYDPLETLAYVAATTRRIRLGTTCSRYFP
jgi:hypothetical protein